MFAGSLAEAEALAGGGGEAGAQLMDIDEGAGEGGSAADGEEEEGGEECRADDAELEPGEHRPSARRRSVAELSEAGQRVRAYACMHACMHACLPSCPNS